jgi:hypothetical protein
MTEQLIIGPAFSHVQHRPAPGSDHRKVTA